MEQFYAILWSLLGTALTILVGWLTRTLISWITSKVKDQKLKTFLIGFTEILGTSVNAISQTFVDDMKKQGTFDANAAAEAKNKCMDMIMNQMTPKMQQYITDNFGNLKDFVSNQIEGFIYKK